MYEKYIKDINIAVLGEDVLDFFTGYLKHHKLNNTNFNIYQGGYNVLELEVLDNDSELYKSQPQFLILLNSIDKYFERYTVIEDKASLHREYLEKTKQIIDTLSKKTKFQIIISNLPCNIDPIFGHYGLNQEHSFSSQIVNFNYKLIQLTRKYNNLRVLDISGIRDMFKDDVRDDRMYYSASTSYNLEFYETLAKQALQIINASVGKVVKCLILDLDNTLWGGIIGDDGIDNIEIGKNGLGKAFQDFQKWIKLLKERGIILCVNSKNYEKFAMEPFQKHEDMILSLEDITVFVANWENKADNIRYIQKVLNIGFDSMVFIDDSIFEREQVKSALSDIIVPDMPEDPTKYLSYLTSLNLFETNSYSSEDNKRTQKYKEESQRLKSSQKFNSVESFLQSLDMEALIESFNEATLARCAQLSQRSNQFNLRTIRYAEADVQQIIKNTNKYIAFSVKIKDKFGDYGLVSMLVAKIKGHELFIENWIMSCRVLKRNVELVVLNHLIGLSKQYNIKRVVGEYLPTPKNILVKDHYQKLGFYQKKNLWYLTVNEFSQIPQNIKII